MNLNRLNALGALVVVLQGFPAKSDVTLAWNPVRSAAITNYAVSWGTNSGAYLFQTNAGIQTSLTLTNLLPGAVYYFSVAAMAADGRRSLASGEILYTNPASGTTPLRPVTIGDAEAATTSPSNPGTGGDAARPPGQSQPDDTAAFSAAYLTNYFGGQFAQSYPDAPATGDIDRMPSLNNEHEFGFPTLPGQQSGKQGQDMSIIIVVSVIVNAALLILAGLLIHDLNSRRIAATGRVEANASLEAQMQERHQSGEPPDHQARCNHIIVNAISEMAVVVSESLNVSRINPAVTQVAQWEAQDLVSQPIDRLLQLPSDGAANAVLSALNEGRKLQDHPAAVRAKSGATFPALVNFVPLRDGDKITGGILTVRLRPQPPRTAA
jgi:PAS domain-containing protein